LQEEKPHQITTRHAPSRGRRALLSFCCSLIFLSTRIGFLPSFSSVLHHQTPSLPTCLVLSLPSPARCALSPCNLPPLLPHRPSRTSSSSAVHMLVVVLLSSCPSCFLMVTVFASSTGRGESSLSVTLKLAADLFCYSHFNRKHELPTFAYPCSPADSAPLHRPASHRQDASDRGRNSAEPNLSQMC
jgi:hypothetical protein